MGDENPIRTLGDYSKPSHEGYRNTIELPAGNNVVPLRSDTIRLVQNGCSFHGLRSEDPNQHLKDFLKLVDSLDLDGENRERTRLRLRTEDPLRHVKHYLSIVDNIQADEATRDTSSSLTEEEGWNRIEEYVQYQDDIWDEPSPSMNASSILEAMQPTLRGRLKRACNQISFLETPTREVGLKNISDLR
ncbi:hypothetical protein Tco_1410822 [Tanacetum coccineum]